MATQQGDREHQNWSENHEQRELNHGSMKNTCALGRPSSLPGEGSHLQADDKHAPYRGNQTDDEERLHSEKNVRPDGNPTGVQNLHTHENDQKLIENTERFDSDGPVSEPDPKHMPSADDGRPGRNGKEHSNNVVDGHF